MQTFVQFISERDRLKTYTNEQLTVLALYADYVAWLARQPQEGKEAPGQYSVSALLLQLELINQYQIACLEHIRHQQNQQAISLPPIPEYLTRNGVNYLNQRPTEIHISDEGLPGGFATQIENMQQFTIAPSTFRLVSGFLLLALACAVGGFYVAYAGLGLPLAVIPVAKAIGFVASFSAVRSIFDFFNAPPPHHSSNTTIALYASIATAATGVLVASSFVFIPFPALVVTNVAAFLFTFLTLDQSIGKLRLNILNANKAEHAPKIALAKIEELDTPTFPTYSLNAWRQPIMDQLKSECGQPENKLDEAVTATTHCYLASRYTAKAKGTLSIDDLNQNLQRRLKA